ncbi:MAG: redoxin family protein [Verrucomicrobiae bacterium]|nr:redoxin family protein [Verrucomicrobiae bacterium]
MLRCVVILLGLAGVLGILPPASGADRAVPNFALIDIEDTNHELYRTPGRAVVLFFAGNGCPVVRQNAAKFLDLRDRFEARGVVFWMVHAFAGDTPREIRHERDRLGLRTLPWLLDRQQALTLSLGVERTAEVIAIDTRDWKIFYRGALDDQQAEGAARPEPGSRHLEEALTAFLDGRPVATPRTLPRGCRITFSKVAPDGAIPDYPTQVAPLLQQHCVPCHRPDGIGPWSMSHHRRVSNYADMIEEVLLTRRMPPWDPHPGYGRFLDSHSLSREETQTLLRWVRAGAPRGDGPDPLEAPLPPLAEWRLGTPDAVLQLPEPQRIPATGVLDYRYVRVANPFTHDVWLSALDVRPGNRKVVHHVILYAKWPGAPDSGTGRGVFFVGWAPGSSALRYPEGVAKRLPAGAELTFELHYTTDGTPQTDRSEIALYLADGPQERSAETRQAVAWDLDIRPGDAESRHLATYAFTRPATLYGMFPHMHLRGKWMRYELLLPNGRRETLLHVPRYDFQWQFSYYLETPRRIPAGAWLLVTGAFDNSSRNPANPDPNRRVTFGEQSWDEMFIGFFEAADDPELTASPAP